MAVRDRGLLRTAGDPEAPPTTVLVMRAGAMAGHLTRAELSEETIMSLAITGKAQA